ncbi:MAG: GDP-mannose 4,6-dehydratase [Alphaproteobacteria bacterium]
MNARPTALVTGGAGFIGSHMVDLLLERGFRVRVVDNLTGGFERNLAHHNADPNLAADWRDIRNLTSDDSVFRNVDFIFHFAGIGDIVPSIEKPADYLSVNAQGTVAVLEGARNAGCSKVVYAASSSCYGLADTPTREDHPIDPQYPYALSKNLGEQAALHWHKVYGLPVNSIRIFNAYGIRSRTTGAYGAVFGVFLKQKLARRPFTVVGDGTQVRDFIYASDVASAFLAAGETPHCGEVYNIGGGAPQSVNRLVELLGGPVEYIPKRPGEPEATWADITKARRDLEWTPCISFEEGVGRVVDRIEDWRDAPLWTSESIETATADWFRFLGKS